MDKNFKWLKSKINKRTWRFIIGIVGGFVLFIGALMVPYPGPGWATVFVGLAILSQEFSWARSLLDKGKTTFKRWEEWVALQHFSIKIVLGLLTAILVVVTIWIFNGYGLVNDWLGLGLGWLKSPFLW